VSIVNTDNLSNNGPAIHERVLSCDAFQNKQKKDEFSLWLQHNAVFHLTMVDRITIQDPETKTPRTEPMPHKAFVRPPGPYRSIHRF
jgi:mannitol-1-phosphate/altronate dehydrogenase